MSVEQEQVQTLYNIELNIAKIYQEKPDLLDAQLEIAISHLIRVYNAEVQGRHAPRNTVRGKASEVVDQIQAVCEMLLGRTGVEDLKGNSINLNAASSNVEEIIVCLKQVKSSMKTWGKQGGRQGYLNFVTKFVEQGMG